LKNINISFRSVHSTTEVAVCTHSGREQIKPLINY